MADPLLPPKFSAVGLVEEWAPLWSSFVEEYPQWVERRTEDRPVYLIPVTILEHIARHRQKRKTLITRADLAAEKAFGALCGSFSPTTVGVWDGRPLNYQLPLLRDAIPFPLGCDIAQMFPDKSESLLTDTLEKLQKNLAAIAHQQLGYAGILMFGGKYGEFRAEKRALHAKWASLRGRYGREPDGHRRANISTNAVIESLRFPLTAAESNCLPKIRETAKNERARVPADVVTFRECASQFMRKWRLSKLVTWDLFEPEGAAEDLPVEVALLVLGPKGKFTHRPHFCHVPSESDLREDVRAKQRRDAKEAGIPSPPGTAIAARKGKPSKYECAYRLWAMESTVRSRYGSPHGLTKYLTVAFQAMLGVTRDRINQIRRIYLSSCRSDEF